MNSEHQMARMSQPRFEVVRSDVEQPWHARLRAGNGEIVWTSEQYARRADAKAAVDLLFEIFGRTRAALKEAGVLVRFVDERQAVSS